jgi:putative oxidoreductase
MTAQMVIGFGGRALLAMLFILAGSAKILGPQPFLQHMAQYNVPKILLPAVIALEIGAGIALLLGWQVKFAAAALGIFSLLTAAVFHHSLGVPAERTQFFKDLALAGALIAMAASAWSAALPE